MALPLPRLPVVALVWRRGSGKRRPLTRPSAARCPPGMHKGWTGRRKWRCQWRPPPDGRHSRHRRRHSPNRPIGATPDFQERRPENAGSADGSPGGGLVRLSAFQTKRRPSSDGALRREDLSLRRAGQPTPQRLDNFQPDCAGRKWSISLFDRMIHAPGTFRSARSCSSPGKSVRADPQGHGWGDRDLTRGGRPQCQARGAQHQGHADPFPPVELLTK